MDITLTDQALTFLVSVLIGIIVGLIFDFFRAVRYNLLKHLTIILDITFWITATIISFYILYKINGVTIRIYEFLGIFFGCIIYFNTISSFFLVLFKKILIIIEKFIKILLYPLLILCKIVSKIFKLFRLFFVKITSPILKRIKSIRIDFIKLLKFKKKK